LCEQDAKKQLLAWHETGKRWTASAEEWKKLHAQLRRERDQYCHIAVKEKEACDELKVTRFY